MRDTAIAPGKQHRADREADEHVSCALYRGCSFNEMTDSKVGMFAQAMLGAGGWGDFPMVACRVEVLGERGWSRVMTRADVGVRYVHVENWHHRIAAANVASESRGEIRAPVFDINVEEASPRFASMRG